MKFDIKILFAIAVTIITCQASAMGTNSGGGGQVVACKDGGKIASVELLDLWEAKNHLNPYLALNPVHSTDSVESQVALGIQRLKGAFELDAIESHNWPSETFLAELLQDVTDAFIYQKNIQPGYFTPVINGLRVELKLVDDAYEVAIPTQPCEVRQAVTFDDGGEVAYENLNLIDRLDNTDKAALYLHEALYKAMRSFSYEESSLRVRRAIGYVMSGYSFERISTKVPASRIECTSAAGTTKIDIYESGMNNFGMVAERIAGVRAMGFSEPAPYSDSSQNLAEFYNEWLAPGGDRPFSLSARDWRSAVDYDMTYSLEVKNVGSSRHTYVSLKTSPGKAHQGATEEVVCRLIGG
jgi:hypothetical protein